MIAAENKAGTCSADDRRHASAVGLDSRRARIVEAAPVHSTPEVGVELEVGAAPFPPHSPKDSFDMLLCFGMCAVKRVPRTVPPTAERDSIRTQRFAIDVLNEPVGMFAEEMRVLFGDEWRNPDSRLEAGVADSLEHAARVSAECGSGLQPVAHRRLIAVVYLNVLQARRMFGDEVEVVEHL